MQQEARPSLPVAWWRPRGWRRRALVAVGLLGLVVVAGLSYSGWRAARAADELVRLTTADPAAASKVDDAAELLDLAGDRLIRGRRALRELERWSWPARASAPLWAWAPGPGGDLSQSRTLICYAGHVLDAATALHATAQAVEATTGAGAPPAALRETARAIETHSGELSDARAHLDQAAGLHGRLDRDRLSSRVRTAVDGVHSLALTLDLAVGIIERAPPVLIATASVLELTGDGDAVAPTRSLAPELTAADVALQEVASLLEAMAGASDGIATLLTLPPADAERFFSEGAVAAGASGDLLGAAARALDTTAAGLPADPAAAAGVGVALRDLETASETAGGAFDDWRWLVARPAEISDLPERLSDLARATAFSVDFLGYDGPRTHLILGQDEDELRPSGGFIGTVWELRFDAGQLTGNRFLSSYEVDADLPIEQWRGSPPGFVLAFGADIIPFRDQNWWSDFPTAANTLAATYLAGTGVAPDTIVALNQGAVERFVDAMGGLQLADDAGGRITGADVRQFLADGRPVPPERLDRPGWDERRAAAVVLISALLDRLTNGRPVDVTGFAVAVGRAGVERDLLVASRNPTAAGFVRDIGWDGALPELAGGGWYLVEANAYGPKISQAIDRAVEQTVRLRPDGSAHTTLRISHRNSAPGSGDCVQPFAPPNAPCYWEFLRLYLPGDVIVTGVPDLRLPSGALASTRFPAGSPTVAVSNGGSGDGPPSSLVSGLTVVPPGERVDLEVEHVTASAVEELPDGAWRYRATTRRQPGLPDAAYRLTVQLPSDACLVAAPEAVSGTADAVTFETPLASRVALELSYVLPGHSGCDPVPGRDRTGR